MKHRLPAIGTTRGFAEAGLLMSYGNVGLCGKDPEGGQAWGLAHRHPTKFDLVIDQRGT